jgi:hypothetical protein
VSDFEEMQCVRTNDFGEMQRDDDVRKFKIGICSSLLWGVMVLHINIII